MEETTEEKALRLDNSLPFDVHTWSEYPAVKYAVDELYEPIKAELPPKVQDKLQKRQLQVLLLDLYVKWVNDPTMYVAIHMGKGHYTQLSSRYNKLHISKITPDLVHILHKLDYIELEQGFFRGARGTGKLTRIRATNKLIDSILVPHGIQGHMVDIAPNTECIILRNADKDDVDYADSELTRNMRRDLLAYNNVLQRTYIDIPTLPDGRIPREDGTHIKITERGKFIRRIFNNETFEDGGRFYGGWWQSINEDWREKIFIWNEPTVEVDYSAYHIILLYAMSGIDYWPAFEADPYTIPGLEDSEHMRDFLKLVLLVVINAESKAAAIMGIRKKICLDQPEKYGWLNDGEIDLGKLVDSFTSYHAPIYPFFFSGAGVKLQRLDSEIASRVINHFTAHDIAVLCVHDSFIVPLMKYQPLLRFMEDSVRQVCGERGYAVPTVESKDNIGGVNFSSDTLKDKMGLMLDSSLESKEWEYQWKVDDFKGLERPRNYYNAE